MTDQEIGSIRRGSTWLQRLAIEVSAEGDVVDPSFDNLELRLDEPMSKHTTSRVGGPCDVWARPGSAEELGELLRRAEACKCPVTFVGSGTNLIVRDGGIRGLVLNLKRMNNIRVLRGDPQTELHIEVEAGCSTGRLLKFALDRDLGGLEFLAGVPGSVGGGLIMNAGTYLGEFVDVVTRVHSRQQGGEARTREAAACGFAYRHSDLPRCEIVTATELCLRPRDPALIEAEVSKLRDHRKAREPKSVWNHGSSFKNPEGDYAGRLIESAGLKGRSIGAAIVSPVHANWLVFDPKAGVPARAHDLLALIEIVREAVFEHSGVRLVQEVEVLGDDLPD